MVIIGKILLFALDVYFWIIIAHVAASWLIAFDVINAKSPQAQKLLYLLQRAVDPVFRPLRRFIPPIAGFDLSPIVVFFGIFILQNLIYDLMILPSYQ